MSRFPLRIAWEEARIEGRLRAYFESFQRHVGFLLVHASTIHRAVSS